MINYRIKCEDNKFIPEMLLNRTTVMVGEKFDDPRDAYAQLYQTLEALKSDISLLMAEIVDKTT